MTSTWSVREGARAGGRRRSRSPPSHRRDDPRDRNHEPMSATLARSSNAGTGLSSGPTAHLSMICPVPPE